MTQAPLPRKQRRPTHVGIYRRIDPHPQEDLYEHYAIHVGRDETFKTHVEENMSREKALELELITPTNPVSRHRIEYELAHVEPIPPEYLDAIQTQIRPANSSRRIGYITYRLHRPTATSRSYYPKGMPLEPSKRLKMTPRLAAFLERVTSGHLERLRPELTHRSSTTFPRQGRELMLQEADLPIGESVSNEIWHAGLDALWKKAVGRK